MTLGEMNAQSFIVGDCIKRQAIAATRVSAGNDASHLNEFSPVHRTFTKNPSELCKKDEEHAAKRRTKRKAANAK
jgi:hypothetical protein